MREVRREEFVSLWYDALKQEHGLCLYMGEPERLVWFQSQLLEARADIKDPRIAELKTHAVEGGLELWIYKPSDAQLP